MDDPVGNIDTTTLTGNNGPDIVELSLDLSTE